MIEIKGLTPLQVELADNIWACNSQEDVADFINTLPKSLKAQAKLVHELMVQAVWDDVVKNQQSFPQVQELLDSIKDQ